MRAADADHNLQPDLIAIVSRDGRLLDFSGGNDLPQLQPQASHRGEALQDVWPSQMADALLQCTRKAIAVRGASELTFELGGKRFEVRATARAPDRASCHVRAALGAQIDPDDTVRVRLSRFERRGFLRRFRESVALATLTDRPAAIAYVQIDAMSALTQSIDLTFSEKLISIALKRLDQLPAAIEPPLTWYMGQLDHSTLAIVFESADRGAVESCLTQICASLREPVQLESLSFHLNPYIGAAILGRDASSAKMLLDCARSAASEARRADAKEPHFFSDTMRIRSLARLDTARELRDAIDNGHVGLRYVGRHDLRSGELATCVGYLRWQHPLRGEIPPSQFLRIAETTGLAEALSRCALSRLQSDFRALAPLLPNHARISFGGLRHHILNAEFYREVERAIEGGAVPATRLELRISERTLLLRDADVFEPLVERGVRLVVDEVGRDSSALRRLASAPLWGLQLDRSWTTRLHSDPAARRMCRAIIGIAQALDLTAIATAVDDAKQCLELAALGCTLGQGDHFPPIGITSNSHAVAAIDDARLQRESI